MADLINLGMHTKRSLKDEVTPYKVALLVLIEEYCKTIGQSSSTDEVHMCDQSFSVTFATNTLNLVFFDSVDMGMAVISL